MSIKTLLIDNYDSYTYNLFQLIAEVNGEPPHVVYNDKTDVASIANLVSKGQVHNIVISPGPGTPTAPGDIGVCLPLLQQQLNVPILGVCLGFQALALAHGGNVVRAPEPVHGRLSGVRHTSHRLFRGIPSGADYQVVRYHSLVVDELSLPDVLEPIAWNCGAEHHALEMGGGGGGGGNSRPQLPPTPPLTAAGNGINTTSKQLEEASKGVLMAIAHRSLPYYGVQYHPESVGTAYGAQLFINFRDLTLEHHGLGGASIPRHLPRPSPLHLAEEFRRVNSSTLLVGSCREPHKEPEAPAGAIEAPAARTIDIEPSTAPLGVVFKQVTGALGCIPGGAQRLFTELCLGGNESDPSSRLDTFWLDSSAIDRARFSFMGGRGGALWRRITYHLPPPPLASSLSAIDNSSNEPMDSRTSVGIEASAAAAAAAAAVAVVSTALAPSPAAPTPGTLKVTNSSGNIEESQVMFWDWMEHELKTKQCAAAAASATETLLPFNFWGGLVGYIGYELKSQSGGCAAYGSSTPDAAFFLADRVIAVDHHTGSVYAVALFEIGQVGQEVEARQWTEETAFAVQRLSSSQLIENGNGNGHSHVAAVNGASKRDGDQGECVHGEKSPPPVFSLREPRERYLENVASCIEALYSGNSYELCLTTELRCPTAPDPWTLYTTLRRVNPAPYAAWLDFSADGGPVVCCSSPERFLQGGRGGWLEAKPIKGTAPRHLHNSLKDTAAAAALESSEKDRAENLMIVDLLRNDLGRVCVPGSVHVPALMQVESFATVHQLVSTVRGQLRPETTPTSAIRAAFPGGSMTGAPKVRSMAILDSLESGPRGIYSGSAGYIAFNGTFDLNIVIRTAVVHNGEIRIGAGGAIVVQSDPQGEFDEMKLKAAALLRAVGMCSGNGEPARLLEK